jgi:methylmalonyl-CoA mutase N-terminal domain/subunit
MQALAAVLGGTQSLHTNGADEALSLPTEESARTALRTQQIIAHESGVTATTDPLAGSYYVESLTTEIEQRAMKLIEQVDILGGAASAIESGFYHSEIGRSAYEHQLAVERGERVVVGVNSFTDDEGPVTDIFRTDESVAADQIERLRSFKASRENRRVGEALGHLSEAARGSENLMPRILDASRAQCTVGEISEALRGVWGVFA